MKSLKIETFLSFAKDIQGKHSQVVSQLDFFLFVFNYQLIYLLFASY